jgi:hypothetical protein
MDQRLSLVTLGVADVAASTAFYGRLGWKPSSASNDSVTFYQLGGIALGLYGREALAEDAHIDSAGTGFGGITLALNMRTREEVDAVLAEAEAAGAAILKPAQDVFWGGYSGYFADIDGHAWEVAWNPGFEITATGAVVLPK